jgi:hypothetical protein
MYKSRYVCASNLSGIGLVLHRHHWDKIDGMKVVIDSCRYIRDDVDDVFQTDYGQL